MFDFNKTIDLDGKIISNISPVYFVAEIGGNFNDFPMAKRLIDDAKEAGVNAVKFQTLEADTITTRNNYIAFNDDKPVSQYQNFLESQVSKELQIEVVKYARDMDITIFSAPSHIKDVEFMEQHLDLPFYKIGSDLLNHVPLLVEVAKIGKPMIVSTGLSYLDEIRESVQAIANTGFKDLILLHCVSNYPANYDEMNLNAIKTLEKEFNCIVGFSDHTLGSEISLAATLVGANLIEKHLTYDKTLKGPDHKLSLTKDEYKTLINSVRNVEKAIGNGLKEPSYAEEKCRETNRVSIIVMEDLLKGQTIEKKSLDIRRPGNGLKPSLIDSIVGKKATQDIPAETPLKEHMFN